jgi:hypothetical protein
MFIFFDRREMLLFVNLLCGRSGRWTVIPAGQPFSDRRRPMMRISATGY